MSQNNPTKERLLLLAKKEFLCRDYQSVSMRDIAQATGMALGNIYYYYQTKSELFSALLSPTLDLIQTTIDHHNTNLVLTPDTFPPNSKNGDPSWHFFDLISENRDDLYLLFFGSKGSSLEHYAEELTNKFYLMGINYIGSMKQRNPQINCDIDLTFIHLYAVMQVSVIKEFVLHRDISIEKIKNFAQTYSLYARAGWKELMNI